MPRGWWSRQWKGIRRGWRWIGRRVPERLWVSVQALRIIWSSTYTEARPSVRIVAVGGQPPARDLGVYILTRANLFGQGENMYRRGEATDFTRTALRDRARVADSWRVGTAVELAYLALKERGW